MPRRRGCDSDRQRSMPGARMMTTDSRQHVDLTSRSRRATIAPFQVRGRFFTAIVLQMAGGPDAEFYKLLDTVLAQAPNFFTNAPFVLDLDNASGVGLSTDFTGLVREMRIRRLPLIGVQNGAPDPNKPAPNLPFTRLPPSPH